MQRWEKFNKETIESMLNSSHSYSEFMCKCGYACCNSGNILNKAKYIIKYYNLDDSHIRKKDKNIIDYSKFKKNSYNYKPANFTKALTELRGHKCEKCGLSEWLGEKIKLEVHHIDGDHFNNELTNLQLLCPNCHSMTPNWRGGNNKKTSNNNIDEITFVNALKTTSTVRQALLKLNLTPYGGNYVRAQKLILKYNIKNQKLNQVILQKDLNNNIINSFDNVDDIIKFFNTEKYTQYGLRKAISNHSIYHNYYWVLD